MEQYKTVLVELLKNNSSKMNFSITIGGESRKITEANCQGD